MTVIEVQEHLTRRAAQLTVRSMAGRWHATLIAAHADGYGSGLDLTEAFVHATNDFDAKIKAAS